MKKLLLVLMLLAGTVSVVPSLAASAQSEQVITVSLPGIWSDLIDEEALIADFEAAHPETRVEVVNQDMTFGGTFDDAETSIEAAEALASSADVVYVDSSTLTTIGTRAGFFLDLSPLVNSDSTLDINDFYPAIWQSFQWDNAIWALPVSADVIMINYNPIAFDEAGIPYPDGNWTLADYTQAARTLTEYDENGEVSLPGLSLGFSGSGNAAFARALTGRGFYDNSTSPETPDLDTPELQALLEEWLALEEEGAVSTGFNERFMEIPISIGPQLFVAASGPGGGPDDIEETVVAHFPGNLVGLEAQGFAVSSGTQYPELAYALASYLTSNPSVAGNIFAATPARFSMGGVDPSIEGPGGFTVNRSNSSEVQTVIDAGLVDALPASELRYAQYIMVALEDMRHGVDALTALRTAEAQAAADLQTADSMRGDVNVVVATPVPEVQLAPGEIELNTAISFAFGGGFVRIGGGEMPNQAAWDALNADFVANNAQVGNVSLELANVSSEAELTETYDCFITTSNLVPTADLSTFLNLDPFMDADVSFDRNDVLNGVLSDLQQDNLTWGMPVAVTPDTLSYDAEMLQQAGLPLPTNGWTIDQFVDALEMLKTLTGDEVPYDPNDPGGAFILKLIAAYGALPIDYRTSPPTINFTDPVTVDAIRQVLDLAVNDLIAYDGLDQQGFTVIVGEGEEQAPIMGTLNFGFGGPEGPFAPNNPETSYPSGSTYIPLSTQIVAGYISATAQNPEACYNWLREVAQHPTLFDGVPALRSAANNPEITSQLAPGTLDLMNQLEAVLGSPNVISFPGGPGGGGGIPMLTNWLYGAFDSYVLEGADLETALEDAHVMTQAYLECASGIVRDNGDGLNPTLFEAYNNCATSVDPSFGQ